MNDATTLTLEAGTDVSAYAEDILLNGSQTSLEIKPMLTTRSAAEWVTVSIDKLHTQSGTIRFMSDTTFDKYAQLHIGNLSGNSTIIFNTLFNEGKGNFVTVDNGSGQHGVIVRDSGQDITAPGSQTLNLINDRSQGANFFLTSDSVNNITAIDGGTYMYSLKKSENKDGMNGNVWYLTTDLQLPEVPPIVIPEKPIPNPDVSTTPSTDAVLSLASSTQFIFDGELQSLRFRQGSLNMNKGQNSGVWGRYLTNNTRIRANNNTAYRLQQDGIELGADTVLTTSGGRLITGGFVSYSDNMIKHARGGASNTDSYSIGAYATYFDDSGVYVDSVLKLNRFNHALNARMTNGHSVQADYHQNAIGVALEMGYHYAWGPQWFAEPYLLTSFFSADTKDVKLNNGMKADIDNNRSLKNEVGTTLGYRISVNSDVIIQPYSRLAIEREFIKSNNVTINDVNDFNNNVSGNVGKYGLGTNIQVNSDTHVFAEINYRKGQYVESPIIGNIGFRVNF
ncbi:autotransporter outer membrane beta-barrel domain-containing protein [Budvicia aquatica]|nr:autotransporter outer membrane beta-barrel domain-containing protein [Budvicia aquatica]